MFRLPDELAPNTALKEAEDNLKLWKEHGGIDGRDNGTVGPSPGIAPPTSTGAATVLGADHRSASEVKIPGRKLLLPFASISGLSAAHVKQCTNLMLQAAVLGYHKRDQIHYTQDSERWWGINHRDLAYKGEVPSKGDCSSYYTWCGWNGFEHFGHRDTFNGESFKAGYTGTLLEHGRTVKTPFPGCAVIYGSAWPGEHVAMYTGGGLVVSFGSEIGPLLLPMRYRSDILSIRSYVN